MKNNSEDAILDTLSNLDNLEQISSFVRTFFVRSPGLNDSDIDALELVVTEAVVNVIEHGYHGETGRPISIQLQLGPSEAGIYIYDWADPFDPTQVPPAILDGNHFDGFGLFIIEQNTNEASYTREPDGRNRGVFIRHIPFSQETILCN